MSFIILFAFLSSFNYKPINSIVNPMEEASLENNKALILVQKINPVDSAVDFNSYLCLDSQVFFLILVLGLGGLGLYHYATLNAAAQCVLDTTFGSSFPFNLSAHLGSSGVTPSIFTQQQLLDAQVAAFFAGVRRECDTREASNAATDIISALDSLNST